MLESSEIGPRSFGLKYYVYREMMIGLCRGVLHVHNRQDPCWQSTPVQLTSYPNPNHSSHSPLPSPSPSQFLQDALDCLFQILTEHTKYCREVFNVLVSDCNINKMADH